MKNTKLDWYKYILLSVKQFNLGAINLKSFLNFSIIVLGWLPEGLIGICATQPKKKRDGILRNATQQDFFFVCPKS